MNPSALVLAAQRVEKLRARLAEMDGLRDELREAEAELREFVNRGARRASPKARGAHTTAILAYLASHPNAQMPEIAAGLGATTVAGHRSTAAALSNLTVAGLVIRSGRVRHFRYRLADAPAAEVAS